ncbi:Hypothetical predicted protein, partial [Scomber scombrus]
LVINARSARSLEIRPRPLPVKIMQSRLYQKHGGKGRAEYWGDSLNAYGRNEILSPIKQHNQLLHPCRTPHGWRGKTEGMI